MCSSFPIISHTLPWGLWWLLIRILFWWVYILYFIYFAYLQYFSAICLSITHAYILFLFLLLLQYILQQTFFAYKMSNFVYIHFTEFQKLFSIDVSMLVFPLLSHIGIGYLNWSLPVCEHWIYELNLALYSLEYILYQWRQGRSKVRMWRRCDCKYQWESVFDISIWYGV